MNKDVIYIDVDDDVTAIIGKIKKAKEKIVAIVPPKRVGTLQSAVNLRLLDRMARNEKKQLVLITNNQALVALAANAQIPVAKNLQTKPEIAEIPAIVVDNGDDIIDGSELPVGDHAKTVKVKDGTRTPQETRSDAIEDTDLVIDGTAATTAGTVATVSGAKAGVRASTTRGKNRPKIPNFDSFRKRLVLIITGAAALGALLVWMFVFAPAATVIITASTAPSPVSTNVLLGGTEATNLEKGSISSLSQKEEKDITVEFTATGEKDVGDKATGTLKVTKLTQSDQDVPAGSRFSASGGLVFITQTDITIPASVPCFPTYCAQGVNVDVTAESAGTNYNGVSGTANGPNGTVGTFQGSTSGGTSKMAKVVSADDIERAKGQLLGVSTDEEKQALIAKFQNGEIVIDGSFTVERGKVTSKPAVDEEAADGKATLTVPTTFTIHAVSKTELDSYLKAYLTPKLSENQKIYSTGVDGATLSNFNKDKDGTMTAAITATGRVGPTIEESAIKERVKGKIYGEVQQDLQSLDGIKEVDVQFSYFWVRRVPNDINKIKIEFKVDTANE